MTTSPSVKPSTNPTVHALYDADYAQWIETTLHKLQIKDYASVDWDNLLDEIADMGRSEKRSLKSNLTVVLLHLLKWQYQPERRSGSWAGSIVEHRERVSDALVLSPSLKPYLEDIFAAAYASAVKRAAAETGLSKSTFPQVCPYTIAQALDDDFMPE